MKKFYDVLSRYVSENQPNFGNGDSVLTMLYEAYSDCNQMEVDQIKAAFEELYRQMNGMELHEMDRILDPVCSLCRSHEQAGFVEGIKVGIMLAHEVRIDGSSVLTSFGDVEDKQ